MSLNAARSASGRRLQTSEQSTGTSIHLCALTTSESARSTPSNAQRSSGQTMADPAYAASTWSHASRARTRPRSPAPDRRMPSTSCRPWRRPRTRRRGRARRAQQSSSTGDCRKVEPRIFTAFSTDEWACSEATTTRSSGVLPRRGQRDKCRRRRGVLDVAVPAGRQAEQLRHPVEHDPSSSVEAGDVRQRIAFWLIVAARSSARIAGSDSRCRSTRSTAATASAVIAGKRISSTSRSTAENGSPCSGADAAAATGRTRARPARAPAARPPARGSARPTRAPPAVPSEVAHRGGPRLFALSPSRPALGTHASDPPRRARFLVGSRVCPVEG